MLRTHFGWCFFPMVCSIYHDLRVHYSIFKIAMFFCNKWIPPKVLFWYGKFLTVHCLWMISFNVGVFPLHPDVLVLVIKVKVWIIFFLLVSRLIRFKVYTVRASGLQSYFYHQWLWYHLIVLVIWDSFGLLLIKNMFFWKYLFTCNYFYLWKWNNHFLCFFFLISAFHEPIIPFTCLSVKDIERHPIPKYNHNHMLKT